MQVDFEQKNISSNTLDKTSNSVLHGNILHEGRTKLRKLGYVENRSIGKEGAFCIEYPKFYLTANKYAIKNGKISNQKEVIYHAIDNKKSLMVYLKQTEKFYIFDPEEILQNHEENLWIRERNGKKEGLVMWNWNIKQGKELLV